MTRRTDLMFKHNFQPSRDPKKGYTAGFLKWCKFAMSDPPASGGSVAIDPEGDPVVKQCWPIVKQFINLASNKMTHILGKFGVPANEKSPFCRSFETPKDLMDALIKFLPHTFSYPDVSGASSQPSDAVDDVDEATQAEEASQGTRSKSVLEKIGKFARQMAKASDNVEDEDDEDSNGDEDLNLSEEVTLPVVIDENELWMKVNLLLNADSFDDILSCVLDPGMLCFLHSLTSATTLISLS